MRVHLLKSAAGLPGDAPLLFDLTGNAFVPGTWEHLGSLTAGGGP